MDPERRIHRAKLQLHLQEPFWGSLAMYLEPVARKGLTYGTMANNGSRLFYDPDGAINDWSDKELLAVIAHEVAHPAFGYFWRRGNRDPFMWNVSDDYKINALLTKSGFELPEGHLHRLDLYNMTSEHIYNKLLDEDDKDKDGDGPDGPDGRPKSGAGSRPPRRGKCGPGGTLDDPDINEQVLRSGQGADGDGDDDDPTQGREGEYRRPLELTWKRRIQEAAQTAKARGRLPGHLQELVDEITQPRLPWREILRDMVTSSLYSDWRLMPPNKKHVWRNIYLPSVHGESIRINFAADTSGSVDISEAGMILGELIGITQQFANWEIHYDQCDHAHQGCWDLSEDYQPDVPFEYRGRGGTSFVPVFEHLAEQEEPPQVLVYATDLMGEFPTTPPDYPVLWLTLPSGHDWPVPFGTKILFDQNS